MYFNLYLQCAVAVLEMKLVDEEKQRSDCDRLTWVGALLQYLYLYSNLYVQCATAMLEMRLIDG